MAEPTLAAVLPDLQAEVSAYLGWPTDTADLDTFQAERLAATIKSGQRQLYYDCDHDWSFLHPLRQLTLTEGLSEFDLFDDFGSLEGLTFLGSSSVLGIVLPAYAEGVVLREQGLCPDQTGQPLMASVRPKKGTAPDHGQRWQLAVFPTPDQDYTLQVSYNVCPDAVTTGKPYAYGGPQLAECLIESCLAIAEQRLDDAMTVHTAKFGQLLQNAIARDNRGKPRLLGQNRDRSLDNRRGSPRSWHGTGISAPFTVNDSETY